MKYRKYQNLKLPIFYPHRNIEKVSIPLKLIPTLHTGLLQRTMCEFRRTRSKVWWSNYYHEDDEADDTDNSALSRASASRYSWRRSLVENNNRNSSSSPSNGSQKSQDSGFSDSESSSPSSCGSSKSDAEKSCDKCGVEQTKNNSNSDTSASKLPETPVRIARPYLLRHKKKDKNNEKAERNLQLVKSKCNSISSYLADCYFPVSDFVHPNDSSTQLPCPTPDCSFSKSQSSESSADVESRTCFIVDELPKKIPQTPNEKTPLGSTETLSSSSSETNDTVRFLDSKQTAEEKPIENPCLNVDSLKTDQNETLDISLLPDPTHTSTPKKEDVRIRSAKKLRRPSPVVVEETKYVHANYTI